MKKFLLSVVVILIFSNLVCKAYGPDNNFVFVVPVNDSSLEQDGVFLINQPGKRASTVDDALSQYKNNYLDYVLSSDGRVIKWASFPIRVYIEPKKQRNIAQRAFLQWQNCSNNLVSFVFVDSPQNAQITVNFFGNLESTSTKEAFISGYSKPYYTNNNITKSEIHILTVHPITKAEMSNDFILFSVLHEIGHSLGFKGHSPNSDDIMAVQTDKIHTTLTARDINTLNMFYKIDNKTLSLSSQKAFNIKLSQAMAYVKAHPEKSTGWANLGDIYRDKKMYSEAIRNYNKAICIEPDVAEYYNLAGMTYYNIGDGRNAFMNLKKACDFEPSNIFYLYQFAFVCYKLGQGQVGASYINEFLRQNPQSISDDKIQNLLRLYNSSAKPKVVPVIVR